MSYDFSQLNDKEFEVFTMDLLSESIGKRIERFMPGRDGGVDGRYFSIGNEKAIRYGQLIGDEKFNDEMEQVLSRDLRPKRRGRPLKTKVAVNDDKIIFCECGVTGCLSSNN